MHKTGSPVLPKGGIATKVVGQLLLRPRGGGGAGRKKGTPPGQQHTLKHTHSRVYATLSHTLRLTAPIYSNFEGGRRGATYTTGGEEGREGISISLIMMRGRPRNIYSSSFGHMMSQRRLWHPDAFFLTDGGGGVAYSLGIYFLTCTEHERHLLKSDFFLF